MQIRTKVGIISTFGIYNVGDIVELPDDIAYTWIKDGLVEKVSSVPRPKEYKGAKKDTESAD